MPAGVGDVTTILHEINQGDPTAANRLFELVYADLHRVASARMAREAPGQTLQPTALIHEAWLRLGGDAQASWQSSGHFFGAAAEAMRRILIDRARRRLAERRGGRMERLNIDDIEAAATGVDDDHILAANDALEKLACEDPKKAELVRLRFFAGLTISQAAEVMGISEPTANRWWAFARAWLMRELRQGGSGA